MIADISYKFYYNDFMEHNDFLQCLTNNDKFLGRDGSYIFLKVLPNLNDIDI